MARDFAGPGSHYCDNVGRSHASNHVYLVADFAKGVFAQKCHDPDCGGFRRAFFCYTLQHTPTSANSTEPQQDTLSRVAKHPEVCVFDSCPALESLRA